MITEVLTHRLPMVKAVLFLKRDIKIELAECETSPYAEYIIDPSNEEFHLIRVNPNADPIKANFFLWHELGHALQCERLGAATLRAQYDKDLVEAGFSENFKAMAIQDEEEVAKYNSLPFEVEANRIASQYADLHQVLI